MKKYLYIITAAFMMMAFVGTMGESVSAKSTVKRVYNTSTKVKGKTTGKRKIVVKIGNNTFEIIKKKKGSYSVSLKKLRLNDKVGKKITVKFYKKNKKKWKKVTTKTLYIIAKDVQLNDIKSDTKVIKGYTIPEYIIKLTMDGKEYNTTASKKKGYFKIDTGKNIKDYDYTLKITKKNGKAYKTFTHEAGTTAAEVVFKKNKKPTLKKTEVKKTYTYKEDGESYKEKKLDAYKLSWTTIGGADGYDIDIYYPAEKKWERIDTVIKNSYKITNLYATKYQFRVKAFKKNGSKKEYGTASNTLTISLNSILWEGNAEDDSKYKEQPFTQKIFDENAFVYQNVVRRNKGADDLVWSNVCYEIAKVRSSTYRDNDKNGVWAHTGVLKDIKNVLLSLGATENYIESILVDFSENLSPYTGKESVISWEKEIAHYNNMTDKEKLCGAIYSRPKKILGAEGYSSGIYCRRGTLDEEVYSGITGNINIDNSIDIYDLDK